MPTIKLEIRSCKDCPFHKKEKVYTGDSFETEFDWTCTYKPFRTIEKSVSWYEEKDVKVPNWCPIKID